MPRETSPRQNSVVDQAAYACRRRRFMLSKGINMGGWAIRGGCRLDADATIDLCELGFHASRGDRNYKNVLGFGWA